MVRRFRFILAVALAPAIATGMDFTHGGSKEACRDPDACRAWIEGRGDITDETPADFARYLKEAPYAPRVLRLDSHGGSLTAGLLLGVFLRQEGFDTEAELCASACLYAFLGGEKRAIVGLEPQLGIHRFYHEKAVAEPDVAAYTGRDLDSTQRAMAGLLLYTLAMGVDPGLIALSADAGPEGMRWLDWKEAVDLKVIYNPLLWEPWEIEGGDTGRQVTAVSSTQDGTKLMQLVCVNRLRVLRLFDTETESSWFEQCRVAPFNGVHYVLGLPVPVSHTAVNAVPGGGAVLSFVLPPGRIDPNQTAIFEEMSDYPMACISHTGAYSGTSAKLQAMSSLIDATCR